MPAFPTLLCILDGFGFNPTAEGNAVNLAKKPNIEKLLRENPSTTLTTFGEAVGLPAGQMGNSEVGHLNIGAGRVVEQWLLRISRALTGTFLDTSKPYLDYVKNINQTLHVIGLYSDGGVHSHKEHLHLLLKRLQKDFSGKVVLHLITDGRDTSPTQAKSSLAELQSFLKSYPAVSIGTISGRFFAMDRDKRWERTKQAFDAIALGKGPECKDLLEYIQKSYTSKVTDEFIEPAVLNSQPIAPGDSLLFWNFREDRMRQIVRALCIEEFTGFERNYTLPNKNKVLCFTDYDHTFELPFLFPILDIKNHLGEWISGLSKRQLRVAETEKYPHVTYFLNGGIEKEYPGEDRKVLPSPRDIKTYDLKPEMSARAVCDTVCQALDSGKYDLIVVNFANCDMVGHTGDLKAAIRAVETVDECLGKILSHLEKKSGKGLIIADHGNCEQMIHYSDGSPHTTHTTYPVPAILIGGSHKAMMHGGGALCDVAPTILKLMGLPVPKEMTGSPLFN